MRILTVCRDLERGGTQRVAQVFTLEYQRHGHEVAILAMNGGGLRQAILDAAGVPVYVGGHSDAELLAATEKALAFKPDVVHYQRAGIEDRRETLVIDRFAGPSCHILETSHFGRVDLSPAGEKIDVHLHLSEWCLWRWRRWVGPRPDPPIGVVIPNPVDVDSFHPADPEQAARYRREVIGVPEDAFLCGRVGQPLESKWHDAVLHAFARLAKREPRAWLALIGMPDEARPALESLPTGVRERVLLRPLVDNDEELALFYSSLDVFLHGARIGETFGLVLAEAMLCGTPAVTMGTPHKDNSQGDVVAHGVGGLVALSAESLGDALVQIHDDDALRARLAAGCRDSIIERFSAGPTAEKALAVMRAAVETSSRAELRTRLEADPTLVTSVDDQRIQQMLSKGVGKTSVGERWLMRLVTQPMLYRLYQRIRRV